jgi:exodeoxyribonuclease V alpha subunit
MMRNTPSAPATPPLKHLPALAALLRQARLNGLEPVDEQTIADVCELSGRHDGELKALLAGLFLALREGSVCLEATPEGIQRRFDGLLDPAAARALALSITDKLASDGFPEAIGGGDTGHKPLIRQTSSGRPLIYFQKFAKHERVLQQLLVERLNAAPNPHPKAGAIFREISTGPQEFSPGQKIAVALALLRNFLVISGGPGTGKTSVVFGVLRALLRGGTSADRIALACPTGRAAQRLTESIRAGAQELDSPANADRALNALAAKTLHRLLGCHPSTGAFTHHRDNPLPFDVVVVDEMSMVDIVMMSRLLEAVPPQAKLILLGDKNQLPSVDAGSVLSDLMPQDGKVQFSAGTAARLAELTGLDLSDAVSASPADALRDSVVVLHKNFRSQPHIQTVAEAVNSLPPDPADPAAAALIDSLPRVNLARAAGGLVWPDTADLIHQGGCWLLEAEHNEDAWQAVIKAWAARHYLNSNYLQLAAKTFAPGSDDSNENPALQHIFSTLRRARVLTLIRDGSHGCAGVNQAIAAHLLRAGQRRNTLFAGAPVLVTSNNHTLEVYNGDVGVALPASGGLRVVFERPAGPGRRYLSIPVETLPAHELAFAMTVHKSQGSEYDEVLLALPPEGAQRLLNRQLLYTAITRARHLAVICGTKAVLRAALSRSLDRASGLNLNSSETSAARYVVGNGVVSNE